MNINHNMTQNTTRQKIVVPSTVAQQLETQDNNQLKKIDILEEDLQIEQKKQIDTILSNPNVSTLKQGETTPWGTTIKLTIPKDQIEQTKKDIYMKGVPINILKAIYWDSANNFYVQLGGAIFKSPSKGGVNNTEIVKMYKTYRPQSNYFGDYKPVALLGQAPDINTISKIKFDKNEEKISIYDNNGKQYKISKSLYESNKDMLAQYNVYSVESTYAPNTIKGKAVADVQNELKRQNAYGFFIDGQGNLNYTGADKKLYTMSINDITNNYQEKLKIEKQLDEARKQGAKITEKTKSDGSIEYDIQYPEKVVEQTTTQRQQPQKPSANATTSTNQTTSQGKNIFDIIADNINKIGTALKNEINKTQTGRQITNSIKEWQGMLDANKKAAQDNTKKYASSKITASNLGRLITAGTQNLVISAVKGISDVVTKPIGTAEGVVRLAGDLNVITPITDYATKTGRATGIPSNSVTGFLTFAGSGTQKVASGIAESIKTDPIGFIGETMGQAVVFGAAGKLTGKVVGKVTNTSSKTVGKTAVVKQTGKIGKGKFINEVRVSPTGKVTTSTIVKNIKNKIIGSKKTNITLKAPKTSKVTTPSSKIKTSGNKAFKVSERPATVNQAKATITKIEKLKNSVKAYEKVKTTTLKELKVSNVKPSVIKVQKKYIDNKINLLKKEIKNQTSSLNKLKVSPLKKASLKRTVIKELKTPEKPLGLLDPITIRELTSRHTGLPIYTKKSLTVKDLAKLVKKGKIKLEKFKAPMQKRIRKQLRKKLVQDVAKRETGIRTKAMRRLMQQKEAKQALREIIDIKKASEGINRKLLKDSQINKGIKIKKPESIKTINKRVNDNIKKVDKAYKEIKSGDGTVQLIELKKPKVINKVKQITRNINKIRKSKNITETKKLYRDSRSIINNINKNVFDKFRQGINKFRLQTAKITKQSRKVKAKIRSGKRVRSKTELARRKQYQRLKTKTKKKLSTKSINQLRKISKGKTALTNFTKTLLKASSGLASALNQAIAASPSIKRPGSTLTVTGKARIIKGRRTGVVTGAIPKSKIVPKSKIKTRQITREVIKVNGKTVVVPKVTNTNAPKTKIVPGTETVQTLITEQKILPDTINRQKIDAITKVLQDTIADQTTIQQIQQIYNILLTGKATTLLRKLPPPKKIKQPDLNSTLRKYKQAFYSYTRSKSFVYTPDLAALVWKQTANNAKQRAKLLKVGRFFTGLERRLIIQRSKNASKSAPRKRTVVKRRPASIKIKSARKSKKKKR